MIIAYTCRNGDYNTSKIITLADYKNSKDRDNLLLPLLEKNALTQDYKNCIGDFVYQKDPTLSLKEIIKWCSNEQKNNIRAFYSHINELEVRENGNYKISFDENIALIKKEKLSQAETKFTSNNTIMDRAIYNDQGSPTLKVFFEELSKATY